MADTTNQADAVLAALPPKGPTAERRGWIRLAREWPIVPLAILTLLVGVRVQGCRFHHVVFRHH